MSTIDEIVKASKDGCVQYDSIEYKGVKLLATKTKIKDLIRVTWEFTKDPEVKKLADELNIELRKLVR
jgi:hypothetical protein